MIDQTEICSLNLEGGVLNVLRAHGIKAFDGSIGNVTKIHYTGSGSTARCLPRVKVPANFHEYHVLVLDLTNDEVVIYDHDYHTHSNIKTIGKSYLYCLHPQDLFDPRPFALKGLREKISENLGKEFLVVIFCDKNEDIIYHRSGLINDIIKVNNYEFLPVVPKRVNRSGLKTSIPNQDGELFAFLKRYNSTFSYDVIFEQPYRTVDGIYGIDPDFTPLVMTTDNKIAGLLWRNEKSGIFFFPKTDNKGLFLADFLSEIAPTYFPHLFPDVVKDKWLEDEIYQVPSHLQLLKERQVLITNFQNSLSLKNKEIDENVLKYAFLTDMLTKNDSQLVSSVLQFLIWLGFEKAIDADKLATSNLKEEDIQIETDRGMIILEVKGIGGKTKDTECSQIGKVRNRRQKERNAFDVYAHFLVNHERHKPAVSRSNPPFTKEQLSDAEYDSRGLMTTWQLFQLYTAVSNNILTKAQVRSCFYQTGYIDFIPDDVIPLGSPSELFTRNKVIILKLEGNVTLKVKDKLLYKDKDEFKTVTIASIMEDMNPVETASKGEFGVQLDQNISKDTILYAYN